MLPRGLSGLADDTTATATRQRVARLRAFFTGGNDRVHFSTAVFLVHLSRVLFYQRRGYFYERVG